MNGLQRFALGPGEKAAHTLVVTQDAEGDRVHVRTYRFGEFDADYAPMRRADFAARITRFLDPTCDRP